MKFNLVMNLVENKTFIIENQIKNFDKLRNTFTIHLDKCFLGSIIQ